MSARRQLAQLCRMGALYMKASPAAASSTLWPQQQLLAGTPLRAYSRGFASSSSTTNGCCLYRTLLRSQQWQSFRCFSQQAAKPAEGGPTPKWGGKSPLSFNSMLLGLAAFLGIVAVAQQKAQDKVQGMMQRSQQVVGKAAVGGPFALVDTANKPFTHENLLGKFSVLYFGFTHCPDICPDELEKLAEAVDLIEKQSGVQVQPVFISIDPLRDTPKKVKAYVAEFHPRLIGLTGSEEAVKGVSKAYRVYFHKTGDDDKDYLVDHSIIMYLIDPAGEFVTFYGKNFTAHQLADSIGQHIAAWQQQGQGGGGSQAAAAAAASSSSKGVMGSQEGKAQR